MNKRWLAGFLVLFAVYQASEGLQTVFAPGNPVGPALMVLALLLAWPVGRWIDGRGYGSFGLVRERWIGILGGGLVLAFLAKLAAQTLAIAVSAEAWTPALAIPAPAIAMAVVTTFFPSVIEDILTRGFLLRFAPRPLGFLTYAFATALLYTANHIWRLDWGISEQVRLFCLGLAYGAAAWRLRSLWGAVGLHWGWNLAGTLAAQAWPGPALDVTAGRLVSAAVHLAIFAILAGWGPRAVDRRRGEVPATG